MKHWDQIFLATQPLQNEHFFVLVVHKQAFVTICMKWYKICTNLPQPKPCFLKIIHVYEIYFWTSLAHSTKKQPSDWNCETLNFGSKRQQMETGKKFGWILKWLRLNGSTVSTITENQYVSKVKENVSNQQIGNSYFNLI